MNNSLAEKTVTSRSVVALPDSFFLELTSTKETDKLARNNVLGVLSVHTYEVTEEYELLFSFESSL